MADRFADVVDIEMRRDKDQHYALEIATRAIIHDLGWDPRQSVRTYTAPTGTRVLFLPARNVTALTATVNGSTVDVEWDASGAVILHRQYQPTVVTYTAGWDPLPGVLVDVCVELAGRVMDSPMGLVRRSWNLGDEAESYFAPSDLATDPRLAPYRLPHGVA